MSNEQKRDFSRVVGWVVLNLNVRFCSTAYNSRNHSAKYLQYNSAECPKNYHKLVLHLQKYRFAATFGTLSSLHLN